MRQRHAAAACGSGCRMRLKYEPGLRLPFLKLGCIRGNRFSRFKVFPFPKNYYWVWYLIVLLDIKNRSKKLWWFWWKKETLSYKTCLIKPFYKKPGLSYKTVSNLERVPNLKRVSISRAFGVTKLESVSKLKRYNFTLSYKSRFKIITRYKVRSGSGRLFSNGKWNAVTNLHWKMKRLL